MKGLALNEAREKHSDEREMWSLLQTSNANISCIEDVPEVLLLVGDVIPCVDCGTWPAEWENVQGTPL